MIIKPHFESELKKTQVAQLQESDLREDFLFLIFIKIVASFSILVPTLLSVAPYTIRA